MMGYSHAVSGAAGWLAVTSTAAGFGWVTLEPTEILAGTVLCAGAALLPDADHPSATIAYSVPGIGKAVTGALGAATGGHRKGMHTIWAVLAVLLASLLLTFVSTVQTQWGAVNIASFLSIIALTAFSTKVLKIVKNWALAWLLGVGFAIALHFLMPEAYTWIPLCVTIGYLIHILGDFLTKGGIAWFFPWLPKPPQWLIDIPYLNRLWQKNGYFSLPILGLTGSWRENILALLMLMYVMYALAVTTGSIWDIDLTIPSLVKYLS